MAFNAMTLARVIQESANGGVMLESVQPYQFASDDLNSCSNEMNYAIIAEAADFKTVLVGSEDIIAETAICNPEKLETLSEGVFDTIKAKVIAFFKKMIAFVKGIIDKIKAAIYKMTGKVSKWCSLMEPKLRNVKGGTDLKVDMYEYDEAYITSGMKDGLTKMIDDYMNESFIKDDKVDSSAVKDYVKGQRQEYIDKGEGTRVDKEHYAEKEESDETKRIVESLEKATEKAKDLLQDWKDKWADQVASSMGVSAGSEIGSVWTAVAKKARGDGDKKGTEVKSRWSSMFSVIQGSTKTLEGIKKVYDKHLSDLNKIHTSISKVGPDLNFKGETKDPKVSGSIATGLRDLWKAHYDSMIDVTSAYETAATQVRQININLMNEMVSSYMGALNKLAGAKPPKENK